jgi:hypothetical protein
LAPDVPARRVGLNVSLQSISRPGLIDLIN